VLTACWSFERRGHMKTRTLIIAACVGDGLFGAVIASAAPSSKKALPLPSRKISLRRSHATGRRCTPGGQPLPPHSRLWSWIVAQPARFP
jgi:hypothetical protein